jgi:uncharacterized membrane protein
MENVLAITFPEDANAYEGLTKLKELDGQDRVALAGAAVVVRNEDGGIVVKDQAGDIGYEGTAAGGILGLLIGVIGGPFGVLVGGATGLMIGSLFDLDDADDTESVLTEMSRSVRVAHTALLAQVSEQSPEVVDAAIAALDGRVVRRPLVEVEGEIAAAEEAQSAAKHEAREKLREQRREERKDKVQAKIADLKSKVHPDRQPAGQAS